MNKNSMKILFASFLLIFGFSFSSMALAISGAVYVSPNTAVKNVGQVFTTTVNLSATDQKVFAVEGTIVFNGLTCQSIFVLDGLMTQSAPSCANPHFLLGIPSGTMQGKTLLAISVKANNSGTASIGFTGVDIIGEGNSISTASSSGIYTISTPTKVITSKTPPVIETQVVESIDIPDTTSVTEPVSQEVNTNDLVASAGATGSSPVSTSTIVIIALVLAVAGLVAWKLYAKKMKKA